MEKNPDLKQRSTTQRLEVFTGTTILVWTAWITAFYSIHNNNEHKGESGGPVASSQQHEHYDWLKTDSYYVSSDVLSHYGRTETGQLALVY